MPHNYGNSDKGSLCLPMFTISARSLLGERVIFNNQRISSQSGINGDECSHEKFHQMVSNGEGYNHVNLEEISFWSTS